MFARGVRDLLGPELAGRFEAIDLELAGLLTGLPAGEDDGAEDLALAVCLLGAAMRRGDSCLDLERLAREGFVFEDGETMEPRGCEEWQHNLGAHGAVGGPDEATPLVLHGGRLALRRYFDYERAVARRLAELARAECDPVPDLALRLGRLFPAAGGRADLQKAAAYVAARRRLTIVSGGPGTGKTATVARILALLLETAPDPGRLRIALAAPTGKAAARLGESIGGWRGKLDCDEPVRRLLPAEAVTLHRLLGMRPHRARPARDAASPLDVDVLVVDEVSMVDLPLFAKMLEALPRRARLVLLGDKDQLASVEAGAVLGELTAGEVNRFSPEQLAGWRAVDDRPGGPQETGPDAAALHDCIIHLTQSWRFGEDSGIARLADAVRAGDSRRALDVLGQGAPDLEWIDTDGAEAARIVAGLALPDFAAAMRAASPDEALAACGGMRILSPLRRGPVGVGALNALVRAGLEERGLVPAGRRWYAGRLVMVSENSHAQRLYNGDVLVAWPGEDGRLAAFVADDAGGSRQIGLLRLPAHETAYAMTVHKSQGSEFGTVVLALPDADSPFLSRELVYTAITRASGRVVVVGGAEVFGLAIGRRTRRMSALAELIGRELG